MNHAFDLDSQKQRVATTSNGQDTAYIPKVENAGETLESREGVSIQIMHNGVKVLTDQYYGSFTSQIIRELKGHHEPQEEKVFYEVLQRIKANGTMLELGCYWSYYSLWFHKAIANAQNYMVEPSQSNLEIGQQNFALNQYDGIFEQAYIGDTVELSQLPPIVTVDWLLEHFGIAELELLHSDIQGSEYAMLKGATHALTNKTIRFLFISTHSNLIHYQCLNHLKRLDYHIIAQHTLPESFSVDGLIVASAKPEFQTEIATTIRPWYMMTSREKLRHIMARAGLFKVLAKIFI